MRKTVSRGRCPRCGELRLVGPWRARSPECGSLWPRLCGVCKVRLVMSDPEVQARLAASLGADLVANAHKTDRGLQ